jgi:hypothetical protein
LSRRGPGLSTLQRDEHARVEGHTAPALFAVAFRTEPRLTQFTEFLSQLSNVVIGDLLAVNKLVELALPRVLWGRFRDQLAQDDGRAGA